MGSTDNEETLRDGSILINHRLGGRQLGGAERRIVRVGGSGSGRGVTGGFEQSCGVCDGLCQLRDVDAGLGGER